jgi:hypothetical protein
VFNSALDAALPVYAIGTALTFVFSLPKKRMSWLIRNALGPVRATLNPT